MDGVNNPLVPQQGPVGGPLPANNADNPVPGRAGREALPSREEVGKKLKKGVSKTLEGIDPVQVLNMIIVSSAILCIVMVMISSGQFASLPPPNEIMGVAMFPIPPASHNLALFGLNMGQAIFRISILYKILHGNQMVAEKREKEGRSRDYQTDVARQVEEAYNLLREAAVRSERAQYRRDQGAF